MIKQAKTACNLFYTILITLKSNLYSNEKMDQNEVWNLNKESLLLKQGLFKSFPICSVHKAISAEDFSIF